MKSKKSARRAASQRGFTLIETLIVLTIIIVVFGSLGVASFKFAKQRGDIASVVRAIQTDKSSISIFTSLALSNGLIPLTKGTVATIPLTGTMASATAAVIGNATTLEIALLGSGALEGASNISLGNSSAPGGTTTAPVLWNQTTQTFYTTGDVAPTYDYSAISTLDCIISAPATAPSTAAGANFRLDGVTNMNANTRVVYRKIPSVTAAAAYALANALYKGTLPALGAACDVGPVVYGAADASGKTTVYVYVTQQ